MSLTLSCEQCHRRLLARPEYRGRSIQCPACGHVQTASEEETPVLDVSPTQQIPLAEERREDEPAPRSSPRGRWRRRDEDDGRYSACPYCDEPIRPDSTTCRWCREEIDPSWLHGEAERMRAQRHRSLLIAGSSAAIAILMGLAVLVGIVVSQEYRLVALLAIPAIAWGLAGVHVARFKGQHPAWGLLALLVWPYFVGPIVLLCIPDKKGKGIRRLERFLARQ